VLELKTINYNRLVKSELNRCATYFKVRSYIPGQTLRTDNPVLPNLLPPDKMLDRTFLMPPEDDGTQYRAKIIALIDNHLAENDFEKQPERLGPESEEPGDTSCEVP